LERSKQEVVEPELAINNALPKLKTGIRIAPFHDGEAAGERYLVEVGETCFVAGKSMRDVLVALADEPETLEALAEIYERQTGQAISTEVLADVLANRIPDSLFDHTPEPKNKRPFIFSFNLIRERWVRPFSTALTFLFAKPIVLLVCAAFLVAEFFVLTRSLKAIQQPFQGWDVLLFYVAIIAVTLFHELGHASACRRFECPHGDIGFALYFIYPAFYTDVTKVWRLTRLKRAVVDVGGIYFQAILFVALTIYVMLTHDLFALRLLWAMNLMMFFTLNPIFKMDGYWLLSDLSGLSNLHRQMRDTLVRVIGKLFRRPASDAVAPQAQGMRLKVLYAYIALALVYYAFIIQFLYQAFDHVLKYYPPRAAYLVEMIRTAYRAGNTERAWQHAGRLAYESVWPLILSLLVGFMLFRVLRFLYRTLSRLLKGRTVTISMPRWAYTVAHTVAGWKARLARHG
jgi:putative peptide zinc metalloprotease protein